MGRTTIKILRKSIHTFLQNYNYFTNVSLLVLPFSASILLSSYLSPDSTSLQHRIHVRVRSLFDAIGIPISSQFFSIFSLKLSQTITSSILLLPFTFSFLLITKTIIIQSLNTHNNKEPPSFTGIFNSILQTQLWNSFIIFSTHATSFWLLFIVFNCLENLKTFSSITSILFISIVGGITYSIFVANSMTICNMALILSGMENKGGFISILKACVIVKRRTQTALSLALFTNITLTAIEVLFEFRMASAYGNSRKKNSNIYFMVLEGLLVAYLYSIIITLDIITGCVFYKRCIKATCKNIVDQEQGKGNGYCLEFRKEKEEHH